MQHNRAGRKLRRTTAHRLAMFSNQLASLMTHERIETTISKAKELRPLAERLITTAKNDDLAARRRVYQWIPDHSTVKKIFETLAPRFVDRPGGYTRILKLGARRGDAAEAAILEFVDFKFQPKEKGPRKESMSDRARRMSGGRVETVRKQKADSEGEAGGEEAPKSARKGRDGRGGAKAARPASRKGPSRTGPSKRGTS
jgi:large subunit ribosomal protein L17